MPLSIPTTTATKANFADALKSFVDGLEVAVDEAQSTANSANTLAGQKYTKPAGGIPTSDLASGAVSVTVRRYVAGAWQVRGTTSTTQTVLWVKTVISDPDPPIDATYFLQGTDLLFKP